MTAGWKYRIVKKEDKYGLYPVFIDDSQDVVNIHNMPVICADSTQGLLKEQNIMYEAWYHPMLDYETGEEI